MYYLFVAGLINTAITPVSTINPINHNHIFIFFFSFGHMVNDTQILLNSSWRTFATFWRLYHSFCHLLLNIAFTLKVVNWLMYSETKAADELELACHICYAVATIGSLVGTLYWFQLHSKMGPIIIQGGYSIPKLGQKVGLMLRPTTVKLLEVVYIRPFQFDIRAKACPNFPVKT